MLNSQELAPATLTGSGAFSRSEGVSVGLFNPAQQLDPLVTVDGFNGTRYSCPDLAAVDAHLDGLRRRIASAADRFPGLVETYRREVDLLLDRRAYLTCDEQPG